MFLMMPVNGWIATRMRIYQQSQMKSKDERIKLMDEILSGIKIIKLCTWEAPFIKKVILLFIYFQGLTFLRLIIYIYRFWEFEKMS